MHLIASMRLFNEAMPAVMPTRTHVDHVALWLLLLLPKAILFSFLKALSVGITFIKDSYDRENPWFGARTRGEVQLSATYQGSGVSLFRFT